MLQRYNVISFLTIDPNANFSRAISFWGEREINDDRTPLLSQSYRFVELHQLTEEPVRLASINLQQIEI